MTSHADWAARGFGPALLPIAPGTKIPHLRRGGGWYPYSWRNEAAPEPAVADGWGAGVGLVGEHYPGWDIDVRAERAARVLREAIDAAAPGGVPRVGAAPKLLMVYRARAGEPLRKWRVEFRLPGEADGAKPHAVELLATGQQYVVDGQHPDGHAYSWPEGRPVEVLLAEMGRAEAEAVKQAVLFALQALGAQVLAQAEGGDGEALDPASLLAPSEALLEEALAVLVPDGTREWWLQAGMSIKGAGGTVEQWEEVSNRWAGPAEDPEDLRKRWDGFRDLRTGWLWIERTARERGGWFGGVAAEFAGVDLGDLSAGEGKVEDESGLTIQERMFRRYVWVEAVERIGDTVRRELLTRTQFNVRMAEIGPPHDSRRCAWAQFLEAKHGEVRARRVGKLTYRPGREAVVEEAGVPCFNTWRPSALRPRAGSVALYEELARRLFPAAEERDGVLDWLAALLQRPGEKPAFVLVIGGHEGIGKDSLVAPVVRALGLHNVSNIPMATVMGPNTHWIAQKQLVIITEMHSFARREVMERLKPIGACPPDTLEVNIKYTPQYDVPNIIAGLYFTNHVDALALSDSDRRHFVAWSPHPNPETLAPAEKQAFETWFRKVYYPWLNSGGAEAVAHWLLQRDLTAHWERARAPMTEGKALMRREGRSEATAALEDALEAMDLPDLVNPADLAARMSTGRGEKPVTGQGVGRVLRAMGAVPVTKDSVAVPATATVTGAKRVRIWALRNETEYRALPDAALARKYAEMWGATIQDIQGFFAPHLAGESLSSEKG